MLTRTSETAIRALLYLALHGRDRLVAPAEIAEKMGCSRGTLARTMSQLVKAGILRSHRGPQGGVSLAKAPEDIDLLSVVSATQGLLIDTSCQCASEALGHVCGFHRVRWDLQNSMMQALKRWRLSDPLAHPFPKGNAPDSVDCLMLFACKERKCHEASN